MGQLPGALGRAREQSAAGVSVCPAWWYQPAALLGAWPFRAGCPTGNVIQDLLIQAPSNLGSSGDT